MRQILKKELQILLILLILVAAVAGYEIKLLHTYQLIDEMCNSKIDYDAFRCFQVSQEALTDAEIKIKHINQGNSQLERLISFDPIDYLTFSMMARDYNLTKLHVVDEQTFLRGIGKVASTDTYRELNSYYRAVLSDIRIFPVPIMSSSDISYIDSWNALRTYGGDRNHEGTDLMALNNLRGYFPVISITDGVVEKKGWLEQGGYRIGIRSETGAYFYYAHLYSYAQELDVGDSVIAGQLLGFMGDSGYGNEGTTGQFPVHLHLGIYIKQKSEDISINPYQVLKILEKNRETYK